MQDDVISRILKRMWNCRGKHTTSIDKVKMEQIIRDELPSVTQKPIEYDDIISRQAVMDCFKKWQPYMATRLWDFEQELSKLPPVTQKCEKCAMNGSGSKYCDNCGQKSGKWISIPYELDYETDAECSLCHEKFIAAMDYNYCPKCGCRMQKSEDEG